MSAMIATAALQPYAHYTLHEDDSVSVHAALRPDDIGARSQGRNCQRARQSAPGMGRAFRSVWRNVAPQLITMKHALTMTAEVLTILLILALGVLILAS